MTVILQSCKAEPQTGFLAQEVEAVAKEIGFASFSGVDKPKNEKDHYGIRYAEFVVPLVKSVQELSSKIELQQKQIEEQKKQIESLLQINDQRGNNEQTGISTLLNKQEFELYQNNPNPFSSTTQIKMVLPETVESAKITIYDMQGKLLKTYVVNGTGNTSVTIEANELQTGMYIYALIADGAVVNTKQMILSK